jgi:hypothetical protein
MTINHEVELTQRLPPSAQFPVKTAALWRGWRAVEVLVFVASTA